jgi:uncharacterized protein (DUF58 family)
MTGLTRRGWAVCASALGMAAAGRILGIPELYAIAVVALGLTAGAVVYVRFAPWQVDAQREIRPPQLHAGGNGRVELAVRNLDARRSPVLSARDPFDDGRRWARFHIAPMRPGETVRAAYRLPTDDRGVFSLGPLQIGLTDPFGLAAKSQQGAPEAKLTVFPRIDVIRPLPQARGADPNGSTGQPSLMAGGDDFYALRPYQTGDDLRRVHWPSSARSDELMIRQDELPWQGRVSVFADLRSSVHSPASFELALSATASIIQSAWHARRQVRLVTTGGTDSGFGSGHAHVTAILGRLAVADGDSGSHLGGGLAILSRGGTTGGVAVVTTEDAADHDLAGFRRLSARFGSVALVVVERSAWDGTAAVRPRGPAMAAARIIRVTADRPFALAWDQAVPPGPGRVAFEVAR